MKYNKQLFGNEATSETTTGFDKGVYCDFSANAVKALAGKDILLAVWNAEGTAISAIAGQQSLKLNRSADSIEVTTKDTGDGWKAYIAGSKEWSIDTDGLYINTDASMQALSTAFENGDPVCIKVYNKKTKKSMFGGLAVITDFPLEAPYDDSMTYSISLKGQGKLVDLSSNPVTPDTLPA